MRQKQARRRTRRHGVLITRNDRNIFGTMVYRSEVPNRGLSETDARGCKAQQGDTNATELGLVFLEVGLNSGGKRLPSGDVPFVLVRRVRVATSDEMSNGFGRRVAQLPALRSGEQFG